MKFIVTGGAGFIGSHMTEYLLDHDHDVVVIDNFSTGSEKNLADVMSNKRLTVIDKDINDVTYALKGLKDTHYIIHLAALADIVPSIEKPEEYFKANVAGTMKMLELARKLKVKRFLYAASSSSYGLSKVYPTNEEVAVDTRYPYAETKYQGERWTMHYGQVYNIPVNSLRFFNVYGPKSRTTGSYGAVFGVFLAQKANKKPYTVVGNGYQSRDFVYVTDVVKAIYMTALADVAGEVFNVGSGNHYTIRSLVAILGGGRCTYLPERPGEPAITQASITKIQGKVGWQPVVDFRAGVLKMLESVEDWKEAPVWTAEKVQEATKTWFKYL